MLQFQTCGSVGVEIAITSKRKILRTSLDLSSYNTFKDGIMSSKSDEYPIERGYY
jgi:hypothetical protein